MPLDFYVDAASGLMIGTPDGEHRLATDEEKQAMRDGLNQRHLRCNICGFLIDAQFEATKPSLDWTTRGRHRADR